VRRSASLPSLPLLLALLPALSTAPPVVAGGEDPARPASDGTREERTDDEDAPAVRATAGGTDLPVGVTLLGPRPPHAVALEALKPGVTLHAPPPQVTWPLISLRVVSVTPSPAPRSLEIPVTLSLLSRRPAPRPPRSLVSPPPRPREGQQLAPPPAAPLLTAWSAFPGGADWVPTAAYRAGDPERPYPWNPVSWSPDAAFDPEWFPESSWPAGVNADDWSPVIWDPLPSWTDWLPTDAWNRALEAPGASDDVTPQP